MEEAVQAVDQAVPVLAPQDHEAMEQALADLEELMEGFQDLPELTEDQVQAHLEWATPFLEVLGEQITAILELLAMLQKSMGEMPQVVSQWVEVPEQEFQPQSSMEEKQELELVVMPLDQLLGAGRLDIPTSSETTTTLMDMDTPTPTIHLTPLGTGLSLPGSHPTIMETPMPLLTTGEDLA